MKYGPYIGVSLFICKTASSGLYKLVIQNSIAAKCPKSMSFILFQNINLVQIIDIFDTIVDHT